MILTQEQISFIKMGLEMYADKAIEWASVNPNISDSLRLYAKQARDLSSQFDEAAVVELTKHSELAGAD